MTRSILGIVLSLYLLILGVVLCTNDDAQYLLFEDRELGGSSQLIESISVPSKTLCSIHCNVLPSCSHFTLTSSDQTSCDLYSSVDRNSMPTVSGRNTYLRLNPSGTFSVDFLSLLETETSSEDGKILWQGSAGDMNSNLDITGVDTLQRCYHICLMNNNGNCWVFSYVSTANRCVVPDFSTGVLTYDLRTSLVEQSVSGASYYMYNSHILLSATAAELESYSTIPGEIYHRGSSVNDMSNNLRIGVDTAEQCFKICTVTNSGNCLLFSFDSTNAICYVPHNDGSLTALTDYSTSTTSGYITYIMFSSSDSDVSFNSGEWSTLSNLRIRDGLSDDTYDVTFSSVADQLDCYRLCTIALSTCQTFSYNPSTQYCYIADANFHDDWTYVEAISGCTSYFLKSTSKWKLLTKHREYQGVVPDDSYNHAGGYQTHAYHADMVFSNSYQANGYLKSQIIDHWASLTSRYRVRLEMYSSGGTLLKYMEYNAVDTTCLNWFSSGKFISSSYSDLHSGVTHNYWSIRDSGRTFYLSRNHGGCSVDAGWLEISSTVNSGCTQWDYTATVPMFLYASGSTYCNWSSTLHHFGVLIIKMSFS